MTKNESFVSFVSFVLNKSFFIILYIYFYLLSIFIFLTLRDKSDKRDKITLRGENFFSEVQRWKP